MSRFWIQIGSNGMPLAVEKRESCPSDLGRNGWEDFGQRGELATLNARITALEAENEKLKSLYTWKRWEVE